MIFRLSYKLMPNTTQNVPPLYPHLLEMSHLCIYAIACQHDLEEEARIAVSYALHTNLLDVPLSEHLRHIDAYSYHQLLMLHRCHFQGVQAPIKMTDTYSAMALLSMWMRHQSGSSCLRRQPNRSWQCTQPLMWCLWHCKHINILVWEYFESILMVHKIFPKYHLPGMRLVWKNIYYYLC